ncbi:hypothetical protein BDV38DRAFT_294798 [Aspergillus pseudotamarii]|uniref:Zn(2)-C6 fungal-type domain-containing protein n=1 Tax=Aspergillus pseudotamarii TaxID=132259 RepID=A0A5N6SP52_ASPPS|nr:uncharacterized protein BDV38DRAFT_294798 [Aspergillus pseudotamarii]KAE8135133.1 hypothetical protein BDV38DRAFT_294798 [Aspergillus pseudotamarii]
MEHALPTTRNSSDGWPRQSGRIRVTRACDRCKKRKVRCNGQQPCRVCTEASVTCSYNASYSRGRRPAVRLTRSRPLAQLTASPLNPQGRDQTASHPGNPDILEESPGVVSQQSASMPLGEPVSRASPEPAQTDLHGHYVGPSSGISFLSRVQKRLEQSVSFPRSLSVFNFGDAPLPYRHTDCGAGDPSSSYLDPTFCLLLNRDDTTRLVHRYFDFAVPVDRFVHRPTIEQWVDEFYETRGVMRDKDAAPAQIAVIFMIFAIAQEHTSPKLSAVEADTSVRYFRAANQQLAKEQGPVRLASVQARLCQCLWLLSQSRINHCWSLFGTVARLIFALGLHRNRHASSSSMTRLEIECRRRTFWSAYCLDNYISTALGRPRTFNDKDIDQELPSYVEDEEVQDRMDVTAPCGGQGLSTMFGPVSYAKLSRILSGVLSDIYAIQPMSITERLSHTTKYMSELKSWRRDMAGFLDQPSSNAAPLVLIYQRQRNVLNLAYWHTVILTNRPLLLTNFARLTNNTRRLPREQNERRGHIDGSITECLRAAMEIVTVVDTMIQAKQLFRSFWFTPYFAFSASVILYVYTIQHSKEPGDVYRSFFAAAERCKQQIMDIAEEGSLTYRYCLVLEELHAEAVRQMTPVQPSVGQPTQTHYAMEMGSEGIEALTSNVGDLTTEFAMGAANMVGMDPLDDFHVSPSASLEDLTGWDQFESMGKVYAVTGGASGIGFATAKLISERGGTVCIADVSADGLRKVELYFSSKTPSVEFMITQVDVSNKQQVANWIADIKAKYHRLDGAANIAGVIGKDHGIKSVAELDDDEWSKIISVNLTGTMYCLRAELNHIVDGGSIVNMASIHATTGVANHGAYAASKHGVLGLTRVAAKENGHREVRVNAVAPGPIYTPMMQGFWDRVERPSDAPFDDPIAFKRQGAPEEVATVVVFLLGPESSFVSGSCYPVDGAWV